MSKQSPVEAIELWLVDEGSPGHFSQSAGLADALGQLIPVKAHRVSGRTKVRGWQRHLIRWLMGKRGAALSDAILSRIADVAIPTEAGSPAMIISSGGKSVFTALALAQRYQVPYVFIGEQKPYPSSWFDCVVSHVKQEASERTIDVELIPTPVASDSSIFAAEPDPKVWCMIIGGSSRSHVYSDDDWHELAEGMNALAQRYQIRWRVTTSRRTGAAAEAILKKHLDTSQVEDAIWWAEAPRRALYDFIRRSSVLFVTQDSVTMVTEAVSARRPVVVVRPQVTHITEDNFMSSYYGRLEQNRRVIRTTTQQLAEAVIEPASFKLMNGDILRPVAEELLKRLNLSSGP